MVSRKNAENIPDGRESNESVLKETNSQRDVVVASEAGNLHSMGRPRKWKTGLRDVIRRIKVEHDMWRSRENMFVWHHGMKAVT